MTLTTGAVTSLIQIDCALVHPARNHILKNYYILHLSSVGYGTQTPASLTGKAIGGVCAVVGVFILTLPVPIVVNSFASYYKV